jgi:hypothetical protein
VNITKELLEITTAQMATGCFPRREKCHDDPEINLRRRDPKLKAFPPSSANSSS